MSDDEEDIDIEYCVYCHRYVGDPCSIGDREMPPHCQRRVARIERELDEYWDKRGAE